jgi:hypothetical protein
MSAGLWHFSEGGASMFGSSMLKNVKIGNRSAVFVTHLIIPDDEQATFQADFRVGYDPQPLWSGSINTPLVHLNVSLLFTSGAGDVDYNYNGGNVSLTFKGWKNPLGNSLLSPLKTGTINMGANAPPLPFGVMLASYWIGNAQAFPTTVPISDRGLNVVIFQVVTGGTYDE